MPNLLYIKKSVYILVVWEALKLNFRYIVLIALIVAMSSVAGCCCLTSHPASNNQIVGTWSNGQAGDDLVSYTFYANDTVIYTTGPYSDHDAATYTGTWSDMGAKYDQDTDEYMGEGYTLLFPDGNIDQDMLLKSSQLKYDDTGFGSDDVSDPNYTMTKQ